MTFIQILSYLIGNDMKSLKTCKGRFGNSDAHYWRFLPHCGHALCYWPAFGKVFLRLQVSDVPERFFRLSQVKWLISGGWVGCCATPTNFSFFDSFSSKFGNISFSDEKMAGLACWSYLNFYFTEKKRLNSSSLL